MKARTLKFASAGALLGTFCILPFAVGFPNRIGPPGDGYDISGILLGLPVIVGLSIFLYARTVDESRRHPFLRTMLGLGLTSAGASALLSLDVHFPIFTIPTPHILAPLLRVDGGVAFNADVFEIYCELWLIVAFVILVIAAIRKWFLRSL